MFDALFQKTFGTREDEVVTDSIYKPLFKHNRYCYIEEEFGQDGELLYPPPPLDKVCLDETKCFY